ncbi:MAG: truD [Cyanobacteria bacterium RYN_339]|nr:truD [Cyanobacteria bacterium RYN_339]
MAEPYLEVDFAHYPVLTADLPAVPGRVKEHDEDFVVDEVPTAPPAGEGDHLHVLLKKRGWTTKVVVDRLREGLGIAEDDMGWAGLKDRHAITTQWISIPRAAVAGLAGVALPEGVELLDRAYHPTKLQEGHLAGNRFRILLRGATDAAGAERILTRLAEQGVPNYYGPQRFGRDGKNPAFGWKLIAKGRGRSKNWRDKFQINALQSLFFNDWLALRLERGLYATMLAGDVAHKFASGGKFLVGADELAEAQERAAKLEICATGPLFGRKYHEAMDAARVLEDEVLAARGLGREHFVGSPGSRRPSKWPLGDWSVEATPDGLWLSFYLPRGAYATAVLRELTRSDFPEETNA